jgi:uncharacterized protein with beta-barrel porin domain
MAETERNASGHSHCIADARLDPSASRRRSLLLLGAATVALLADGTIAAADGLTIASTPGSALLVAQSQTISSLADGGFAGGTVFIADGQTLTTGDASSTTFSGTMTGSNGGLIKQGSGTFTLGGSVALGGLWVNAGELAIGTGTSTSTASFARADVAAGATLYIASGATLTIRTPGTLVNNGFLINNGTVNDDLANTGTFNNNVFYNANVASNTGTINNNAPGVWTGNVLSNAASISNNIGATWVGTVVNTGSMRNFGAWSGDIVSNFFHDIYNIGSAATWKGNVLTNDSQIVNESGATWTGEVLSNNNVVFNLSSSFWNGNVVANGGGPNDLAQIENYGIWTGNVESNAATVFNLAGSWNGNVLGNAGFIINNSNDVNTNPTGANHAVWNGDVINSSGFIINDHGGLWNGNVRANTGLIISQSGANWTGNVLGNAGTIINNATWSGNVDSNTGKITNNAIWIGTVANAGTFNNNAGATVSGLLVNSGATNNAGTLSGGLSNTAGITTNTGSIGGTTTISGGTLTGNGTIANLTLGNGATFAPGTPGTAGTAATVAGNLAFQSGTFYAVQVNAATASLARVSGTATLAGTVQATFALGSYVEKQYTILTAAGGLNGTTFAGLANTGLPQGGADSLSYDANNVYLNLKLSFLQFAGLNSNQQAVANVLTRYFDGAGGIPVGFFTASPGGLAQLDGEAATGAVNAAFQLTSQFLNLMLDPFMDGRAGPGGPGSGGSGGQGLRFAPDAPAAWPADVALAYAGVLKAPSAARFTQRWTAWGAAFGGGSSIGGDPAAGSSSVTAHTFGIASGMDYRVSPDTTVGFALAGGGTNWGLSGGLGGGSSEAFQAGGYGVTHAGPAYLAGAVSFANHWFSTSRTALGDLLTGSFQGQSYGVRVEGGYRFAVLPSFAVTPYAALQAQHFSITRFSEADVSGGGFGLSYAPTQARDVRSELGLWLDQPTMLAGMPLVLRGRVGWAHDTVGNPALGATFEALPGAAFLVNGAALPTDSALTSARAQVFITSQWSLLAKFDGEFAQGAQSYAGSGTLRYTW